MAPRAIPVGQAIRAPKLLFEKLEVPQASGAEAADMIRRTDTMTEFNAPAKPPQKLCVIITRTP
jgi:hypothetical protein